MFSRARAHCERVRLGQKLSTEAFRRILMRGLSGSAKRDARGLAAVRPHRHSQPMATTRQRQRVLIINGSSGGEHGNTAVLLERAARLLRRRAAVTFVVLAPGSTYIEVRQKLARADALLVGTGTYWDGWSHHLQRMLEDATPDEGSALWLGKPAAVVVTMHAVGGKAVLSRLQGVLNTLGCAIPPMSGLVYSLVNQAAIQAGANGANDLWCVEDVDTVCENLLSALTPGARYRAWPTDRVSFREKWII